MLGAGGVDAGKENDRDARKHLSHDGERLVVRNAESDLGGAVERGGRGHDHIELRVRLRLPWQPALPPHRQASRGFDPIDLAARLEPPARRGRQRHRNPVISLVQRFGQPLP